MILNGVLEGNPSFRNGVLTTDKILSGTTNQLAEFTMFRSYRETNIARPTAIGMRGMSITINAGERDRVASQGTILGLASSIVACNTQQAGAEYAPLYSCMRFDQGTGFPNSGIPGRGWLTDYTVHGAIDVQQEVNNGINLVMANYYNGQPANSPMGGIWLAAATGIGGSLDATHAAATRYPNGVGLGIVGTSTGGTLYGWDVGIQIGGSGSGWEVGSSSLGKGITIRDYNTDGIYLDNAKVATARGLVIGLNGGNALIGKDIAIDGSNYTEPKLLVAKGNSAFAVGVGQGNTNHIFAVATDAAAANVGATIGLGAQVNTGVYRAMGYIAGRKTNATAGNSDGYLQFGTHKNGIGMREWLRIDADGLFTLGDATNFVLNATTGTKIGTAASQKLGFYNATPIVQPASVPAASTDLTTVVALANDLRTKLLALGLIA